MFAFGVLAGGWCPGARSASPPSPYAVVPVLRVLDPVGLLLSMPPNSYGASARQEMPVVSLGQWPSRGYPNHA